MIARQPSTGQNDADDTSLFQLNSDKRDLFFEFVYRWWPLQKTVRFYVRTAILNSQQPITQPPAANITQPPAANNSAASDSKTATANSDLCLTPPPAANA